MSSLTLTVVTMDALAPQVPMAATFCTEGGTLGRDESSTLVLPDKHRRVSRLHGTIRFNGSVAVLTNASTSLPIMVGDRQLDYGDTQELGDGVYIEVGPYVLVAHYNTVEARAARAAQLSPRVPDNPLTAERSALAMRAEPEGMPGPAPLMASPVGPAPILPESALGDGDPFDALLEGLGPSSPMVPDPSALPGASTDAGPLAGSPAPMKADPPAQHVIQSFPEPVAPTLPSVSRVFQAPAAPIIPEDFNPFDLPSEAPRNAFDPLAELAPPPSPAQMALDGGETPPVESLFPPTAPTLRDPLLDAFGSPASVAAPMPLADGTLESLVRTSGPTAPLSLQTGAAEPPPQAPVADQTPEYRAAFQPPQAIDPLAALTGGIPDEMPAAMPGDPFADLL
ncbi:MAG: FHA domain-containing protein, partial [Casimicrobiaceae bacterium]